jgi:hypothetical protein
MAWGQFGFAQRDSVPIDDWMNSRNAEVTQRDAYDAAGRERWENSNRSGDYLDASQPSDVVALGNATWATTPSPPAPSDATPVAGALVDRPRQPASFDGIGVRGSMLSTGNAVRKQCIEECAPLLERFQPPGSDKNQWDFHRCVNDCLERSRKASPMVPRPSPPAPRPIPWWMLIPRLIPELPLVPA